MTVGLCATGSKIDTTGRKGDTAISPAAEPASSDKIDRLMDKVKNATTYLAEKEKAILRMIGSVVSGPPRLGKIIRQPAPQIEPGKVDIAPWRSMPTKN